MVLDVMVWSVYVDVTGRDMSGHQSQEITTMNQTTTINGVALLAHIIRDVANSGTFVYYDYLRREHLPNVNERAVVEQGGDARLELFDKLDELYAQHGAPLTAMLHGLADAVGALPEDHPAGGIVERAVEILADGQPHFSADASASFIRDTAVGVTRPHHFQSWVTNLALTVAVDATRPNGGDTNGLAYNVQELELADDPIVALALVNALHEDLSTAEEHAVGAARAAGLSWERIALLLGRSKQAVWQAYGQELPELVLHDDLSPITGSGREADGRASS